MIFFAKHATFKSILQVSSLNLHSSARLDAGKLWRQKAGLPKLQTARGPLTDLPDYSFLDGRPTPLAVGQVNRRELQNKLTVDALNGLQFLNRAKELIKDIDSSNSK